MSKIVVGIDNKHNQLGCGHALGRKEEGAKGTSEQRKDKNDNKTNRLLCEPIAHNQTMVKSKSKVNGDILANASNNKGKNCSSNILKLIKPRNSPRDVVKQQLAELSNCFRKNIEKRDQAREVKPNSEYRQSVRGLINDNLLEKNRSRPSYQSCSSLSSENKTCGITKENLPKTIKVDLFGNYMREFGSIAESKPVVIEPKKGLINSNSYANHGNHQANIQSNRSYNKQVDLKSPNSSLYMSTLRETGSKNNGPTLKKKTQQTSSAGDFIQPHPDLQVRTHEILSPLIPNRSSGHNQWNFLEKVEEEDGEFKLDYQLEDTPTTTFRTNSSIYTSLLGANVAKLEKSYIGGYMQKKKEANISADLKNSKVNKSPDLKLKTPAMKTIVNNYSSKAKDPSEKNLKSKSPLNNNQKASSFETQKSSVSNKQTKNVASEDNCKTQNTTTFCDYPKTSDHTDHLVQVEFDWSDHNEGNIYNRDFLENTSRIEDPPKYKYDNFKPKSRDMRKSSMSLTKDSILEGYKISKLLGRVIL